MLAKVLARRILRVLEEVISLNQSALIGGRNILDGVVAVNDIVDEAKKKKEKMFLFKIDFEKAYHSVDWKFLLEMMRMLGFGEKWVGWILECISMEEASILIKGSPTSPFKMGRGLQQGDPLFPFLFLIVAEGPRRMMWVACSNGLFSPWKVGNNEVSILHLQYVDDTICFGEAKVEKLMHLSVFLGVFHGSQGLR